MQRPRRRRRRLRQKKTLATKIVVKPQIKPKSEANDTLQKITPQMPRSNGIVFKVKVKKK